MNGSNQFALLRTRRFLPLFITQAIGAFNDNVFRFALSILVIFDLGARSDVNAELINTLAAGCLIVPFFLFSATAGQLADKYDKAMLARRIKLVEIFVIALASFSLFTDLVWLQLLCMFLTGTQSAFFGPIKYAILPQHLAREELLGGNGMVEMATFLAILLGTMFGGFFVLHGFGREAVSLVMTGLAVIAWLSSRMIPPAPAQQVELRVEANFLAETWRLIDRTRKQKGVFRAILGVSWFWLLGSVFLTQIPNYAHRDIGADQAVANLIIAIFTVSIGIGSVATNRLLRGEVSVRYVPAAAALMSLFMLDLYFATGHLRALAPAAGGLTPAEMLGHLAGWRVLADLALIAAFAGIYVVPLFAWMQQYSPPESRARTIAANNIMNAVFMTVATGISAVLIGAGVSANGLFLLLGIANALAAVVITRLLPQQSVASLLRLLFRLFYRVEARGLENLPVGKAVIIANHTSLIDAPLISAYLPERCAFALTIHMAGRRWTKLGAMLFDLLVTDPSNPMTLRALVDALRKDRKVVIFPEQRLTVTGTLMKIYEGPSAIAHMADAPIVPVRIDGAQYSPFSRMRGKLRLRWFPKVILTFLPPVDVAAPEGLKGTALREHLADKLYDTMTDMVFRTSPIDRTLFESLLDARAIHGGAHKIMEDIQRNPMSYDRLLLGSFILSRKIAALAPGETTIGVLLPNAAGTFMTLMGLHVAGRVPAMLNFSTGAVNMAAACAAADVRTIVTSRRFVEAGGLETDVALLAQRARILHVEDVRGTVGLADKLYGLWARAFPMAALKSAGWNRDPRAPAVILFTSGSEGMPKGVVLSHRNLQANRFQAFARIDFTAQDIVFNALPMFHAFGLTAGTLLPVLSGVRTFLYPSPLHYKVIPQLCYETDATILFGTDTFLMGYARNAHPYDFYNMRFVVAGAERVKPDTRETWMEKFGIRILEGYGVTECAPVLAVNTPMHFKTGTVGRLLDRIEYRLDPVEGIAEGGRLVVRGPNVMLGYLRADTPGVIEPPHDGWHDTGDIVSIDAQGFATILGRVKRFAKIAGEMVSLGAVETKIQAAFPDAGHAVVAVPDKKKGEQIVLFTTLAGLDRPKLAAKLKAAGVSELLAPRHVQVVKELPVLGSGKTDYVTLNRLAREMRG